MESDVEVNLIFVWNHQNQDLGGSIFGIKIIGTSQSFGSFYDPRLELLHVENPYQNTIDFYAWNNWNLN
jgi:hypothetical protein